MVSSFFLQLLMTSFFFFFFLPKFSVNVSNAVIFGLKQDLNITSGNKYNIALAIFYVPYILSEIPSNLLMKKCKPHVWCTFYFWILSIQAI